MEYKSIIENYQNYFHNMLKNSANETDNSNGLKFGKTLLCLKQICQITHKESVEDLFFNNESTSNSKILVISEINEKLENISSKTSEFQIHKQEITKANQINSLMFSLQLPSYLNAYYSSLQRKTNTVDAKSFQRNSFPHSLLNNFRQPFFLQLPSQTQSSV